MLISAIKSSLAGHDQSGFDVSFFIVMLPHCTLNRVSLPYLAFRESIVSASLRLVRTYIQTMRVS
jgi:hypothetical protein